ncbi:hypothetical protein D3C78_1740400 [compost metagenome]
MASTAAAWASFRSGGWSALAGARAVLRLRLSSRATGPPADRLPWYAVGLRKGGGNVGSITSPNGRW